MARLKSRSSVRRLQSLRRISWDYAHEAITTERFFTEAFADSSCKEAISQTQVEVVKVFSTSHSKMKSTQTSSMTNEACWAWQTLDRIRIWVNSSSHIRNKTISMDHTRHLVKSSMAGKHLILWKKNQLTPQISRSMKLKSTKLLYMPIQLLILNKSDLPATNPFITRDW